jgi:hypothetical protein
MCLLTLGCNINTTIHQQQNTDTLKFNIEKFIFISLLLIAILDFYSEEEQKGMT